MEISVNVMNLQTLYVPKVSPSYKLRTPGLGNFVIFTPQLVAGYFGILKILNHRTLANMGGNSVQIAVLLAKVHIHCLIKIKYHLLALDSAKLFKGWGETH
ncbi:MAG: hypothetical protein Fur0025_31930 [Oscillatoriaceae cyanobacterium]